jgi:hypothetical protein
MEFERTLRYPVQNDAWKRTVLIGGLLIVVGVLIVPLFAVYGYLVRTIRDSLKGTSTPPIFDDWRSLIIEGAQAWVISVLYLLIPILVAAVTVGGSITAFTNGGGTATALGTGGLLIGTVVSGVLAVLFGYLAVIGIVNFAREERFGAAFDTQVIRSVAFDRRYAIPWIISVGIAFIAGLIGAIPVIGWILTPFASFYAAVVAANLWATGFEAASDGSAEWIPPSEEEATA